MDRTRLILVLLFFIWLTPKPAFSDPDLSGLDGPSIHEGQRTPISGTDWILSQYPLSQGTDRKGVEKEEALQQETQEEESDTEARDKEAKGMPDPLHPFNKAMFQFNDRFYFWLLKPVTQVYKEVVPEPGRILFNNFFDNLKAPARLINDLLQARTKDAGNELVRFVFNSTAGLGGLADAAKELLHIEKIPSDFGETLGRSGIGHGFYLVLPILGPSSLRDGIGLAADRAMYPVTYLSFVVPFEASAGINAFETVNYTSFHIGDYEAFKQAAIDPYVSMRNAYFQNRKKAVQKIRNDSK